MWTCITKPSSCTTLAYITACFQCHKRSLLSQCWALTHFLFSRETRWDVGIPGVCTAFAALRGRLQSGHRQATSHQQENNTSRDQCEYRQGAQADRLATFSHLRVQTYACSWFSFILFLVLFQSLFERQGMTLHGVLHPGIERGHIQIPKGMSRTKSFGKPPLL